MKNSNIPFKATTPRRKNLRRGLFLIPLVLAVAGVSLAPTARALRPPPDGGYPNETTAEGDGALSSLTTGEGNTALGSNALNANTTGNNNTATGTNALRFHITGDHNTATGRAAPVFNADGEGTSAGGALTTGDLNIDIANEGVAGEANTIRIGTRGDQTRTFIAGISGAPVAGAAVKVNANGQLGVAPSSERFKAEIKPMDKASEAILALKPVTFRYKKELDPKGNPQFGLVAEQVEKVNPALVDRDGKGEIYTVRYEAVNAMLLNEFLKEHCKVEEQEATVAQQQKEIQALTASLKEQASQIQKVSAQLEVSKPTRQMVINNP